MWTVAGFLGMWAVCRIQAWYKCGLDYFLLVWNVIGFSLLVSPQKKRITFISNTKYRRVGRPVVFLLGTYTCMCLSIGGDTALFPHSLSQKKCVCRCITFP